MSTAPSSFLSWAPPARAALRQAARIRAGLIWAIIHQTSQDPRVLTKIAGRWTPRTSLFTLDLPQLRVNNMARLVISDGSTTKNVELTDASTVAGRAPENKIVIDDKQASRRHFTIDRIEYGFKLVDLESRNGTRVNDRQGNQMLLRPGDKIQIGKHTLTFEDPNFKEPPPEVAAKLAPSPAAPASHGGLPVATEAPKPVVLTPPAPAPAPEIDYRAKRNRSGHTTAVQKNVQVQLQEESKTLTMVAIG